MKHALAFAALLSSTIAFAVPSQGRSLVEAMESFDANTQRCASQKTPAACKLMQDGLAEIRRLGYCSVQADMQGQWLPCDQVAALQEPAKRQWYGADINKSGCIAAQSPADKIRDIQSFGERASTNDLRSGAVEVSRELRGGRSEVWTFYPSMEACEAALPRNQRINPRYE